MRGVKLKWGSRFAAPRGIHILSIVLAQAAEAAKPSLNSALVGLGVSVIQVLVSLGFAMLAVYAGIRIFDKFTKNIDEMAELKRGNTAIGVLLAAVIISYANVIAGGVRSLTSVVLNIANQNVTASLVGLAGGIVNLLVALGLASAAIYIALSIFGKITKEMDEQAELKRGNVAVAFLLAGILFGVSTVIASGVESVGAAIGTLGQALF